VVVGRRLDLRGPGVRAGGLRHRAERVRDLSVEGLPAKGMEAELLTDEPVAGAVQLARRLTAKNPEGRSPSD